MSIDTSGRVLHGWNPEDEESWDKALAWRTLSVTTFSMILAFAVWFLVSAIAPKLNDIGFNLSAGQLYWLAALPGLSGGAIRLIYMFLPPILGTRKLVGITSILLAIPMLGWGFAVTNPQTPYWVLVVLALMTGIGGAIWTFVCGVGMTIGTIVVSFLVKPTDPSQFWWFFGAMMAVFFFSGIGNAGTFKQMPMILNPRQAGGVIGWTAAIAAFGPFIVGMLLSALDPQVFFIGCAVFFAFATALTWIYYARPNAPFPS